MTKSSDEQNNDQLNWNRYIEYICKIFHNVILFLQKEEKYCGSHVLLTYIIHLHTHECSKAFRSTRTLQWCNKGPNGDLTHRRFNRKSTVCSGADQRNHQISTSLAFLMGIHQWPVNSPHKGPVTRKCFHLMTSSWSFPTNLISWITVSSWLSHPHWRWYLKKSKNSQILCNYL